MPNIRPEVPLNTALIPLTREYGYALVDTLHERVGETRLPDGAPLPSAETKRFSGVWARALGNRGFHKADGGLMNHGTDYDYSLGGLQAGVDVYTKVGANGSLDRAGLYLGFGRLGADVADVFSGQAGGVDFNAYSIGGYWTHMNSLIGSGWYTDLVLQGSFYTADADSRLGEQTSTNGRGFTASLETGYAFDLGRGWAVEPQAQLAYQAVSIDDTQDSYGRFTYDDGDSLRGRAGMRVSKLWNTGTEEEPRHLSTWMRVNVWHEFQGDSAITASALSGGNPVHLASTADDTWGEIGLGVAGQVTKHTSLFVTGGYEHSLSGHEREGWSGRVGITYEW